MAYKKYIKRNGKLYGPYIYHSRRVNGKVTSEYQGTGKRTNYKKFVFIFLGIILVLGAGYGIVSNKAELTGNVVNVISPLENAAQEEIVINYDENLIDETKDINFVSKEIVSDILFLSDKEKQILLSEFGDENVKSEMKSFNDRTIVRYEYGERWIENSYDSYLAPEELEKQMEIDRIKWLRDIINQISKEEI